MKGEVVILSKRLSVTEKVSLFQRRIYFKAKQESKFSFYSLYDKICLTEVLLESYRRVKAKGGCSGIDRINFTDIKNIGIGNYLYEIQQDLKSYSYKSSAVKRVYISKENGQKRSLGIPTIRDRIVQMAVKIVIEPIFEAQFKDFSYGFRPKRSIQDAIIKLRSNLYHGYAYVLDADISAYFDTIPHQNLMKLLGNNISDNSILNLIKMWLKAPIAEENGFKASKIGTPQGGVISPLLSNIYLHVLDKIIDNPKGFYRYMDIKVIRYADDFILMSKKPLHMVLKRLTSTLAKMGLKLNTQKSKVLNGYRESFCFLGFQVICMPSKFKGTKRNYYFNIRPSPKSRKNLYRKIREYLRSRGHWHVCKMVAGLNAILRGWINNFLISGVTYIWNTVENLINHLDYKLYKWFKEKSQRHNKSFRRKVYEKLKDGYHLLDIVNYVRQRHRCKV